MSLPQTLQAAYDVLACLLGLRAEFPFQPVTNTLEYLFHRTSKHDLLPLRKSVPH